MYKLAIYLVNEGKTREEIMGIINRVISNAIDDGHNRARAYKNRHEIGRVSLADIAVPPQSAHRFLAELFQECCVRHVFGDNIRSIFADEHVRRIHSILANHRGTHQLQREYDALNVSAIVFPN